MPLVKSKSSWPRLFIEITIKKNKGITKFKLRTSKRLYTLKVDKKEKADLIMQAVPPSTRLHYSLDISKVVIEKKKGKPKKA